MFVPVKPIAERLGLAWKPQFVKLTSNEALWRPNLMVTETPAGPRETLCIPVNRIAMWLAGISPNRVRPEVRETLAIYQTEAADVLDRHFRLRLAAEEAALAETRETLARARALALAANPVWNRIARLKEAGVGALAMPYMARLPARQCHSIIEAMIDGGLIDVDFSDPRHPQDFYREVRLTDWGRPLPDPSPDPAEAPEAAVGELSRPGSPAAPAEG